MINVLNLFTTLDNGGVESFLYNYYSHMDHKLIHYDFVVPGTAKGFLEDTFSHMGCKIFHVPTFHDNPIRQAYLIYRILKEGKYDVIHCHGYKSTIGLILGKLLGIKVRIIHSHMAFETLNTRSRIVKNIMVAFANKCCNVKLACGIDAARWLYGERTYKDGDITIINNAIDINHFLYKDSNRLSKRKELHLEDSFVVGNIARLSFQKNQEFILDVIKIVSRKVPSIKLVLVGDGEDKQKLLEESKALGIYDKVLFLGVRKDIPELFSAFDIFALPSRFEGLPVVLVEAQAAGIKSLVSDNVTKEIRITNRLHYLPLDCNLWADEIYKIFRVKYLGTKNRIDYGKKLYKSKYDIDLQVKKLISLYMRAVIKCGKGKYY